MAVLALAEGASLRTILHATHRIWSEGLTPGAYERYWAAQVATAWGRRALRRYALVEGDAVLAVLTAAVITGGDSLSCTTARKARTRAET